MRLIDADELKKRKMDINDHHKIHNTFGGGLLFAIDMIDKSPTIDAVPVCRCGECRHGRKGILGMIYCNIYARRHCDDWFCADGKRKGGTSDDLAV